MSALPDLTASVQRSAGDSVDEEWGEAHPSPPVEPVTAADFASLARECQGYALQTTDPHVAAHFVRMAALWWKRAANVATNIATREDTVDKT